MNFNQISYVTRAELVTAGHAITLGTIHQLLAAGLGYKSLAALQASTEENPGIEGAAYMLLDLKGIVRRARTLGVNSNLDPILIDTIIGAIRICADAPKVFRDIDEFFDEVVASSVTDDIFESEEINSAAATTNAYFSNASAELSSEPDDLIQALHTWDVPVTGTVEMDQDPDRVFFGDKIVFDGVVRFKKAGRVCLGADMDVDILSATVDDSDYYPNE